ncbi:MAG: Rrf2 family transcriptional regulator [Coriobacteriia bacterium]|nr:Rrf2 family transcriptional regulator [Coriobacteriia bacterium]
MRVSQRLDYALQALVMLATMPAGTHIAAGDLAQNLRLPKRFVEQQVTLMAHAGIVTCRRGAAGGCALARPAAEITVAEVVEAVQGEVLDVPRQPGSASAELWAEAAGTLHSFLANVTLQELGRRQAELDADSQPLYYI